MNRTTMKAVSSALLLATLAGGAYAQCESRWVKANDGATDDRFGSSVAMNESWLVVGARANDNAKGTNAGAMYIYARFGDAFIQVHKGIPTTANASSQVGESVDVWGNYAITGFGDTDGTTGGATVYHIATNTWAQQATLTPAGLSAGDQFGRSVALDNVTAIVGAPGDDDTDTDSGAVYFFTRTGTTWADSGKMTLFSNPGSRIGESVALDGTVAAIGAPDRDAPGVSNAGAVFTVRQGLGWNLSQTLVASNPQADEDFGRDVDIQGDTIVVGAPMSDHAGNVDVGAVYVFERNGQTFQFAQRLVAPDGDFGVRFGRAVSVSGNRIAVGAWLNGNTKTYFFNRGVNGTWDFESVYNPGGSVGYAEDVAIEGTTIVVGDDYRTLDNNPDQTGAVQAIELNPDTGANSFYDAVPVAVPSTHTGCTAGATNDWDTTCGTSNDSPDVWYEFTAPSTGVISIDTLGSLYDTVLSIHRISQVIILNGETLVCNDDVVPLIDSDSRVTMNVQAGSTYRVRVSGFNGARGEYTMHIRMQCPADLTHAAVPGNAGYGIPNGTLNNDDFFYYLSQFAAGNALVADMTTTAIPGTPGYGQPNGIINNDDFFYYLSTFAQGC